MTIYYFDTSALVKRYVPENGSDWVARLLDEQNSQGKLLHTVLFSQLAIVEAASAFAKVEREGKLSQRQRDNLLARFFRDVGNRYETLEINRPLLYAAAELTQTHVLRSYDAVHLATALSISGSLNTRYAETLIFTSADTILLKAAAAEGLTIENPNQHLEQE